MDSRKLIIAIFVIVVLNMIFVVMLNKQQMKEIIAKANEISLNLEDKIEDVSKTVDFLHLTATCFFQDPHKIQYGLASEVKYIDKNNSYALDSEKKDFATISKEVNLLGYGKALHDKKILDEMNIALELAPFFQLVYEKNKMFAWVYYYSKNHFTVLYPYVSSKDFKVTPSLEKKDFFQYATPKLNPHRKLFFTPLYMDVIGKGLMITIGKPVYLNDEFMGTVDIDITLNHLDNVLSRLDTLKNQSMVYNRHHQLIASAHLIENFHRSKIYKIDEYLPSSAIALEDTSDTLQYSDAKYIYTKTLFCSEFKFVYMVNAYKLWFHSILYDIPLFLLMLFFVYFFYLYYRTKDLNKKLKLQTIRDYMTGAYNRRYFFEVAEAFVLRAQRQDKKLAVIMIDIDDFKNINDTYGHDVGDLAIKEVCKVLERNLRKYDLFARFGGEEFAILVDDIIKEDVQRLAEKIRNDFEENEIIYDGQPIKYTVSFGIVYGMMDSIQNFLKVADEALYNSKNSGKNQVTIYEV